MAESQEHMELRAKIVKEINANIVKPINWSECRNSKLAVKRCKQEFNSQNQENPIFKLERKANIDVIIEADLKGQVKFNASVSVL
jgi:hypothetical protein